MDIQTKNTIAFDLWYVMAIKELLSQTSDEVFTSNMLHAASHKSFESYFASLSEDYKKSVLKQMKEESESDILLESDVIFQKRIHYAIFTRRNFEPSELDGFYDFVVRSRKDKIQKILQRQLDSGKTMDDLIGEIIGAFTDTKLGDKGIKADQIFIYHFFESEKVWDEDSLFEFWKTFLMEITPKPISDALAQS